MRGGGGGYVKSKGQRHGITEGRGEGEREERVMSRSCELSPQPWIWTKEIANISVDTMTHTHAQ